MIEQDEAHTENTRYILAVMLERKKILIETDSQKTRTGLLRIYEHRYSGEVFIVKDPQIPLSEVTPLQEEVQKLLSPDEETETLSGGEGEDARSPISSSRMPGVRRAPHRCPKAAAYVPRRIGTLTTPEKVAGNDGG